MRFHGKAWYAVALAVAGILALACSSSKSTNGLTSVKLQLKWVTQAQFGGYYAAVEKGFYKAEGLDVQLVPGGPDITPEQVVAGSRADFGLDWLPSLLASRE